MPLYTFHLCKLNGVAASFEAWELPHDGATFAKAGELLVEHLSCDYVEVRSGDRAVLARHRFQPVIRPIFELAAAAATAPAAAPSPGASERSQ